MAFFKKHIAINQKGSIFKKEINETFSIFKKDKIHEPLPKLTYSSVLKNPPIESLKKVTFYNHQNPQIIKDVNPNDYPLKNSWNLWWKKPMILNVNNMMSEKDYKLLLHKINQKPISNVLDFWAHINYIVPVQNINNSKKELAETSSYYFMKDGFEPIWDIKQNEKGGEFKMTIKKFKRGKIIPINDIWEDLLMSLINDEKLIQIDEQNDEIIGCGIKVYRTKYIILIWTKNAECQKKINTADFFSKYLKIVDIYNLVYESFDDKKKKLQ